MSRHSDVTKLHRPPDVKSAIYGLISDVIVTSSVMGLASNLHTSSARYLGRRVQSLAFLPLGVAEILREK